MVARWEPGGAVSVPLRAVSEKWQHYYWPLLEGDKVIPQINAEGDGGKPMAFRRKLAALIKECRRAGDLSAFARMQAEGSLPQSAARLSREAIRIIGSTIVKGPVEYAGGARGEKEFGFDAGARRTLVQADVWRELSLMGHWIRDAVILRWTADCPCCSRISLCSDFGVCANTGLDWNCDIGNATRRAGCNQLWCEGECSGRYRHDTFDCCCPIQPGCDTNTPESWRGCECS